MKHDQGSSPSILIRMNVSSKWSTFGKMIK